MAVILTSSAREQAALHGRFLGKTAVVRPPDMRERVPEDDPAHVVVEGVERVAVSAFTVNERGAGSARYHPRRMPALPIDCSADGIFGFGLRADGIYTNVLAEARRCILVPVDCDVHGRKHFPAIEDGFREPAESWKALL